MRPPDALNEVWRAALWILEALPPLRNANGPALPPMRRRKVEALLTSVAYSQGAAHRALFEEVVPGVPFYWLLLWWADDEEIESPVLEYAITARMDFGATMLAAAGSRRAAHAVLTAFARRRVAEPDTAFSESAIRTAIVAGLQAGR